MEKENWIWMPHAAHYCCRQDCLFIMATYVGDYIVSTVGEYLPRCPRYRSGIAMVKGIKLESESETEFINKIGYQDVCMGHKYETMVFKAAESEHKCCPFTITGDELDQERYNDPGYAARGHYRICQVWSKK